MASSQFLHTPHYSSLQRHRFAFGSSTSPSFFFTSTNPRKSPTPRLPPLKFNLFEVMGGRGLLNGEAGLEKELIKPKTQNPENPDHSSTPAETTDISTPSTTSPLSELISIKDDAFQKELQGFTGGFPGGEKGVQKFIELCRKEKEQIKDGLIDRVGMISPTKAKAPELPVLMPGMIVVVKNQNNPFHMYCGIIQRVTDGKAGVLFEGGNWDKLLTFELWELERREKGPPMVNPKSVVLETLLEDQ